MEQYYYAVFSTYGNELTRISKWFTTAKEALEMSDSILDNTVVINFQQTLIDAREFQRIELML